MGLAEAPLTGDWLSLNSGPAIGGIVGSANDVNLQHSSPVDDGHRASNAAENPGADTDAAAARAGADRKQHFVVPAAAAIAGAGRIADKGGNHGSPKQLRGVSALQDNFNSAFEV